MSKKTIRVEVLEDLKVSLIFKIDEETRERKVKFILPDIVKQRWFFKSEKEEAALAGYASAIANEFISYGLSEEETAARFKTLLKRTVKAGLLRRKNAKDEGR